MPIDYSHYPPDWKERRQRILSRSQHCCEHCGVANYALIYRGKGNQYDQTAKGKDYQDARRLRAGLVSMGLPRPIIIILTVAHLDHDEWNHEVEDSRLAALCQRCHFHYDRPDNIRRKKYGKLYRKSQLELIS